MSGHNPVDVWVLLFEQTPVIWRWVFGILTAGLYFLARVIWKNHIQRIDKLEVLIVASTKETQNQIKEIHKFLLESK